MKDWIDQILILFVLYYFWTDKRLFGLFVPIICSTIDFLALVPL